MKYSAHLSYSRVTISGRSNGKKTPFSWGEGADAQKVEDLNRLWVRGGFPLSYLAETDPESMQWRQNYVRTFLEQDIPNLGIHIPAAHIRRFWMMLAHYHGELMNYSELGNTLDISQHTVKKYLDILTGTFMVRTLTPWHENISKRQVKSPKIYLRDSGLFHYFLGIPGYTQLLTTPKMGASWEGFALESLIRHLNADPHDCCFWATHAHAELDLLILQNGERLGFEFKFTQAPKLTKSMQIAMQDLKLNRLTVIYPGAQIIRLAPQITALGLQKILSTDFKNANILEN